MPDNIHWLTTALLGIAMTALLIFQAFIAREVYGANGRLAGIEQVLIASSSANSEILSWVKEMERRLDTVENHAATGRVRMNQIEKELAR